MCIEIKKKRKKEKNGKRQGMILVCININRIFKFSCMREINNYYWIDEISCVAHKLLLHGFYNFIKILLLDYMILSLDILDNKNSDILKKYLTIKYI